MQQVLLTTRFFTISTFDIKLEYTTIKTTFLTLSQSLVNLLALFIINLLTWPPQLIRSALRTTNFNSSTSVYEPISHAA